MVVIHHEGREAYIKPSLSHMDNRNACVSAYPDQWEALFDNFPVGSRDGVGENVSVEHANVRSKSRWVLHRLRVLNQRMNYDKALA